MKIFSSTTSEARFCLYGINIGQSITGVRNDENLKTSISKARRDILKKVNKTDGTFVQDILPVKST